MTVPNILQARRPLRAQTPLAENVLVPTRLVGSEGVSRPFRFMVDFVSPRASIPAREVLGKPVSLLVDGPKEADRRFHGLIARWTELGASGPAKLSRYSAEVVPWLWMLGLAADCRTFEKKSVTDILTLVFRGAGFPDFRFRLMAEPPKLDYVVQYQETHFAFVSRLLEEHGLYYAFEHTASKHTMVISDSVGTLIPAGIQPALEFNPARTPIPNIPNLPNLPNIPGLPNIPNIPNVPGGSPGKAAGKAAGAAVGGLVGSLLGPLGSTAGGILGGLVGDWVEDLIDSIFGTGTPAPNAVTEIAREHVVHTKTYAARDFHLLRARDQGNNTSNDPGASGEQFAFLGDEAPTPAAGEAAALTRRWIEAEESARDVVRGGSTAPTLTPGTRVKVTGGPLGAAGEELHILEVAHVAQVGDLLGGGDLKLRLVNEFTAIPVGTRYRPPRVTPHPSVQGTQTALVVGSGGAGQIDVDANGRVLLEFPWDRGDGKDGASKHRVPLASFWAGAGWGAVHLPRVSQLVLVEFLEGDPDRPIVTGRVYSRQHAHPYDLPANKTQSGIKSRTVGGEAENFNELRFEDKQGEEHVFLQAERDLQVLVKHNEDREVKEDRTTLIKKNDRLTVEDGEHKMFVQKGNQIMIAHEGDQFVRVGTGNQDISVKQGNQTLQTHRGNQTVSISGGRTITVGGDQKTTVHGKRSAEVKGDDTIHVVGDLTIEVDGKIVIKSAVSIKLDAPEIELKGAAGTLKVDASGVSMQGPKIAAKADAAAEIGAAQVTIKANGIVQIDGPMTEVKGSGLVKVAGGLTMIN